MQSELEEGGGLGVGGRGRKRGASCLRAPCPALCGLQQSGTGTSAPGPRGWSPLPASASELPAGQQVGAGVTQPERLTRLPAFPPPGTIELEMARRCFWWEDKNVASVSTHLLRHTPRIRGETWTFVERPGSWGPRASPHANGEIESLTGRWQLTSFSVSSPFRPPKSCIAFTFDRLMTSYFISQFWGWMCTNG